jgi:hypothetical protein
MDRGLLSMNNACYVGKGRIWVYMMAKHYIPHINPTQGKLKLVVAASCYFSIPIHNA